MKKVIFTIAGIPLCIKFKDNECIPTSFRGFTNNSKKPHKQIWHLESLGIEKTDFFSYAACLKHKISFIKERFHYSNLPLNDWQEKQKNLFYLYSRYPKLLPRISFYFNEPVEINPKERKLRHFYFKENVINEPGIAYSRLITFIYSQILAYMEGVLLHCACVAKENVAYLFFAKAGGGKTTLTKLSKRYSVLGDDIIAIRKIENKFLAFATPWRQNTFIRPKASLAVPIKAVFFLNKSRPLHFEPISPQEALVRVLSQYIHFFLYTELPLAKRIFFRLADFFKTIPAYEMYFRKDDNFWPILDRIMK
ncbi:MAG: hypothetical protein Q8O13_06325 [Candidatus Omnitrophota bacterium]|nr:hypothetical protein [Candidatus Omnitrophota bacterium]